MTRTAAYNCGHLRLTCDGPPVVVSMCHCLECQRRTGAVFSNQLGSNCSDLRERNRNHAPVQLRAFSDIPVLSDLRFDPFIGRRRRSETGARLSWKPANSS
jgi:hypothetical protein